MARVMVVGSGARELALARAFRRSSKCADIVAFASSRNPHLQELCGAYHVGNVSDPAAVTAFAVENKAAFCVIGPEAPLGNGVADALTAKGVVAIGPTQLLAQIETSKSFARQLMKNFGVSGCPEFKTFSSTGGLAEYIDTVLNGQYVVKADGLMGGKGVKVSGDHLANTAEGVAFAQECFEKGMPVVIEEKLVGEEFSLICFTDGVTAAHLPPVQDHKRAYVGDTGPNTGGMGSYSCQDGLLPFLTPADLAAAQRINEDTLRALKQWSGQPYKGVLYGSFICTKRGVSVIEFNARFGDPEAINLLPTLQTDLVEICQHIEAGTLKQEHVVCAPVATVVKYAVPEGYPDAPVKNQKLDVSAVQDPSGLFYAAVDLTHDGLVQTGSRAIAVAAAAATIEEAEAKCEQEIRRIKGPLFHRPDIGTAALLQQRVDHMRQLRCMRLGVLGSTRGSDLQPILDAIHDGVLNATVQVVVSDRSAAYILQRARIHGVNAVFIGGKGKTREEYDSQVTAVLEQNGVEMVLLVGFMRIVSAAFCDRWHGRCINVHPSLLPKHAALMDMDVHKAVLAAGDAESGCTVHQVEAAVDEGAICLQLKCPVAPTDTPESLKAKVQALEGQALIQAIQLAIEGSLPTNPARAKPAAALSYKEAGVDIDAGNDLVGHIKPLAKSTHRAGVMGGIGGFGGLFDLAAAGYKDAILVSGTDGVGTKLRIAQMAGDHSSIGIDLVAMCVNDVIVQGAEPLFFLDYFATGKLKVEEATAVISGIAEGCRQAGCALVGGETAEMPSMYAPGDYDLAGFSVGAVGRDNLLPRIGKEQGGAAAGDILLGLSSSGLHSNGFSLARKIVDAAGLDPRGPAPFAQGKTVSQALLVPTRIYVKSCLAAIRTGHVKALAHITGGGLTENIPRVLPESLAADIDCSAWGMPPVFTWMCKAGNVDPEEMARTFNLGIGMVIVVAPEHEAAVKAALAGAGEDAITLGGLIARWEDGPAVLLRGLEGALQC